MAMEKNKLVKKAHKDYEYLTGDEATRRLQELREKAILDENSAFKTGLKRGEEKGLKQGEERGQKNKAIKVAIEMLNDNISIEQIMKYTGLNNITLQKLMKKV